MDFANRTVIVTGGTGALGRAVVGTLLAAGARCRVPYILDAEAASFPHHDNVTLVPGCDLSEEAGVARLYDGATGLWASIHIAGGFAMGDVADTDKAAVMHMLNTNFVSCHLCCRAALRSFQTTGGRIVNVTARPGIEPRLGAGMAAYAASKAAVAAFTQALAAEVAGQGILVNAVAPSIIDTPANRAAMPKADHDAWPKPEEIAATIAFLASPENKVTTGAVVPVSGRT
jgi:NAD(P)-dependent dehydrogenase (short-subunit alcohol dehydrogenase family)